jgi:lipopolysaccharide export system permease protein
LVKLSKYLVKDFLTTFSVAMLLITFAFSLGAIYKAVDIMAKGFPVGVVARFFVYNLPYSMAYTIPISALFSTLLLFGRLSTDSELSAMKSGGLSLWQIASPIVLISVVLTLVCFWNNFYIYPQTTYFNRQLIQSLGVEDPIKLLEEGRFVRDFPGWVIYVGKKSANQVEDVIAYQVDEDTGKVLMSLRADRGILKVDQKNSIINVELEGCRMEASDSEGTGELGKIGIAPSSERIKNIRLDFKELLQQKNKVYPKRKNMIFSELMYRIRNPEQGYSWLPSDNWAKERVRDLIEINQRICLSLAPFMFVLIAIPLGIRSHRKESSAGMLISLAMVFVYYIFIILSDTFDEALALRPWLWPWIPIIAGQIAAFILMRRAE